MPDRPDFATDDDLVAVIAAHPYSGVLGDYDTPPKFGRFIQCGEGCDWEQNIAGMSGPSSWVAAHAAHVADEVRTHCPPERAPAPLAGLAEAIAARLTRIHFDGEGCGTYGPNACSNCFGPSPMSAHELGRDLAVEVRRLQDAAATAPAIPERNCDLCGDPVRSHHGNGGQWLGTTPPRDWANCHGLPEGPKHVVDGVTRPSPLAAGCCEQCLVDRAANPPTRMTSTEQRDLHAAFERDRWAGEWNSLPTAIDRLLRERNLPRP